MSKRDKSMRVNRLTPAVEAAWFRNLCHHETPEDSKRFFDSVVGPNRKKLVLEDEVTEWTDVNDGLPPEGQHVLTYMPYHGGMKIDYLVESFNVRAWANQLMHDADNITHWHPLPPPPEDPKDA